MQGLSWWCQNCHIVSVHEVVSSSRILECNTPFIRMGVVQNGLDQSPLSDAVSDFEGVKECNAPYDTV